MQLLSYRGPECSGGVSSALGRLVNSFQSKNEWWHVVHTSIIDQCVKLNIPLPSLAHLRVIDNLWLQSALAELE